MKISEILFKLDEIAPFELQDSWDNSGLLIGSKDDEVSNIVLSLDIDDKVISKTPNNSLIITHHPLIFSGIKQLNFSKYPANFIQKLIQKSIKLISLHTNFDKAILNRYVLEKVLKLEVSEKLDDYILIAKIDMSGKEFLEYVKTNLNLPFTKYTQLPKRVKRIALTTGAGTSLLKKIYNKNIDVFLTGDIKYHEAMESKSMNLSLIDIGHFESEIHFSKALSLLLENLEINIIIIDSENPFHYK